MRIVNIGKLALLAFVLFLQGCVAYQVGGDIQRGRMELLYGDPKVALGYFERAAELDPDAAHIRGNIDVGVKPGIVLISLR